MQPLSKPAEHPDARGRSRGPLCPVRSEFEVSCEIELDASYSHEGPSNKHD